MLRGDPQSRPTLTLLGGDTPVGVNIVKWLMDLKRGPSLKVITTTIRCLEDGLVTYHCPDWWASRRVRSAVLGAELCINLLPPSEYDKFGLVIGWCVKGRTAYMDNCRNRDLLEAMTSKLRLVTIPIVQNVDSLPFDFFTQELINECKHRDLGPLNVEAYVEVIGNDGRAICPPGDLEGLLAASAWTGKLEAADRSDLGKVRLRKHLMYRPATDFSFKSALGVDEAFLDVERVWFPAGEATRFTLDQTQVRLKPTLESDDHDYHVGVFHGAAMGAQSGKMDLLRKMIPCVDFSNSLLVGGLSRRGWGDDNPLKLRFSIIADCTTNSRHLAALPPTNRVPDFQRGAVYETDQAEGFRVLCLMLMAELLLHPLAKAGHVTPMELVKLTNSRLYVCERFKEWGVRRRHSFDHDLLLNNDAASLHHQRRRRRRCDVFC